MKLDEYDYLLVGIAVGGFIGVILLVAFNPWFACYFPYFVLIGVMIRMIAKMWEKPRDGDDG